MNKIELTADEAEAIKSLIELNIFEIIRNDIDIDNINWLLCVMSVYKKCKEAREDEVSNEKETENRVSEVEEHYAQASE